MSPMSPGPQVPALEICNEDKVWEKVWVGEMCKQGGKLGSVEAYQADVSKACFVFKSPAVPASIDVAHRVMAKWSLEVLPTDTSSVIFKPEKNDDVTTIRKFIHYLTHETGDNTKAGMVLLNDLFVLFVLAPRSYGIEKYFPPSKIVPENFIKDSPDIQHLLSKIKNDQEANRSKHPPHKPAKPVSQPLSKSSSSVNVTDIPTTVAPELLGPNFTGPVNALNLLAVLSGQQQQPEQMQILQQIVQNQLNEQLRQLQPQQPQQLQHPQQSQPPSQQSQPPQSQPPQQILQQIQQLRQMQKR